jgi:hypothetical protein
MVGEVDRPHAALPQLALDRAVADLLSDDRVVVHTV